MCDAAQRRLIRVGAQRLQSCPGACCSAMRDDDEQHREKHRHGEEGVARSRANRRLLYHMWLKGGAEEPEEGGWQSPERGCGFEVMCWVWVGAKDVRSCGVWVLLLANCKEKSSSSPIRSRSSTRAAKNLPNKQTTCLVFCYGCAKNLKHKV